MIKEHLEVSPYESVFADATRLPGELECPSPPDTTDSYDNLTSRIHQVLRSHLPIPPRSPVQNPFVDP